MSKDKNQTDQYNDLFSGVIGHEYDMLKLICPLATEMSRLVGVATKTYCQHFQSPVSVIELGGGTGITTLALLMANEALSILSIDNSQTMQHQAEESLNSWVAQGRLTFSNDDALTALKRIESDSVDIIASAYTLHNFVDTYREEVLHEIYRVLKVKGQFINGDRYGLDNISAHTQLIQQEVAGYFNVLCHLNKLDVLEHWIIHLFNDESENHVMRESMAMAQLRRIGFSNITLSHRLKVNALVVAQKN